MRPVDVDPPIRAVPPSHYQVYLNSSEWRRTRNRALKRAGFQCSKCPARRSLEVHHLTYERLGCERDADIEVLCVTCHRGEHLANPDQTSLGVYLKLASVAVQAEPFASIADIAEAIRCACAEFKIPAKPERINSAIAVVIGNRLQTAPRVEVQTPRTEPRAVTPAEAREVLFRLSAAFGQMSICQMSSSTPRSVIDIYAPPPRPDWGEHDNY